MRIHDWFEYNARTRPDIPFLVMDGVTLTNAEADRRANRWANAMRGAGLVKGDRIAYLSMNDLDMGVMFMACMKIGVAPVMLNYRLAPREWLWILQDSDPRMLFAAGAEYQAAIDGIRTDLPMIEQFVAVGETAGADWVPLADMLATEDDAKPEDTVGPDDMLYLIYTSGTTGHPKGVMITHRNVITHIEQSMVASPASRAPGQRAMVATPLYHAAGALRIMTASINCGTVVLLAQYDIEKFLHTLSSERINTVNMVPSIIQELLEVPDIERMDFRHLEVIYYGAAPIAVTVLKKALSVFSCTLIQGYGLSESAGGIAYLNEVDHRKALDGRPELLQSTGRAVVLAEIRIVDPDGNEVPAGTVGELIVRGPNVMKGYWRNPKGTEEAIRDGWLYTGDAARLDEEGYVYLHDRIKDMIVSGGTNIYPTEIEHALLEHDDILDVAVVGVPDEKWGEAPLAFCVLRDGADVSADALIAFCRDRLGGYKIPRRYEFTADLPRNASGKLLKRVLREPYWKDTTRGVA